MNDLEVRIRRVLVQESERIPDNPAVVRPLDSHRPRRRVVAAAAAFVAVFLLIGLASFVFRPASSGVVAHLPEDLSPPEATTAQVDDPAPPWAPATSQASDATTTTVSPSEGRVTTVPAESEGVVITTEGPVQILAFRPLAAPPNPEPPAEGGWELGTKPTGSRVEAMFEMSTGWDWYELPEAFIIVSDTGDETLSIAGFVAGRAADIRLIGFTEAPLVLDPDAYIELLDVTPVAAVIPLGDWSPREIEKTIETDTATLPLPEVGSSIMNGYTGPLDRDMFQSPIDPVVAVDTLDDAPEVYPCEGDAEALRSAQVGNSRAHDDPASAFAAFLEEHGMDLFGHRGGYHEIVIGSEVVGYGMPLELDPTQYVVFVEVDEVADGWVVTGWRSSGC